MSKEPYPLPGQTPGRLRLIVDNPNPEFGATREEYEERVFHDASHFNIVRFKAHGGSEIATTPSFRKALVIALANDEHRYLIYVVGKNGEAFCMSPKDYPKFARLYVNRQTQEN